MRVIIADDQPEVRSALRLLLEEKPGTRIMGEAGTSYELLAQVRSHCPDIILLDWELPGAKLKELLSLMRSLCPRLRIIVLSSRPQVRQSALDAGAHDFVCKSDPPEGLLAAIDRCSPGSASLDPETE